MASVHSLHLHGLSLNLNSVWGLSENFAHLRQDLLSCTSSLESFQLSSSRGDLREVGQAVYGTEDLTPFNDAFEILRSAKKLRALHLHLTLTHNLDAPLITLARRFLEATVSSNIRSLKLTRVRVEEDVLLKVLPRWAPSLRLVALNVVGIYSVHKGWPAVLHVLSTMLNLGNLELRSLVETSEADRVNCSTVSPEPPFTTSKSRGVGGKKILDGRMEVLSGLEGLLSKPLMYQDYHGRYTGQRSNVDGRFRTRAGGRRSVWKLERCDMIATGRLEYKAHVFVSAQKQQELPTPRMSERRNNGLGVWNGSSLL